MEEVRYRPIGLIRSPFKDSGGMPIQPPGAEGVAGTVEVFAEYAEGLKDLDGFSHIILLYHFHRSAGFSLMVKPFLDDASHGVFSTRAPRRPNPIGISVVRLAEIQGVNLRVEDVDVLDGTPLLDVKPYVPEFDVREVKGVGWLSGRVGGVHTMKADRRFR